MEIIKIGNDSLKISLTREETREYDFSSEDSRGKKTLGCLMNEVKRKIGIDFATDKISAEIYVSKDGGSEIFVSKVPIEKALPKGNSKQTTKSIYRFEHLEHLLPVCRRLEQISYNNESTVYHSEEFGDYYLMLKGIYPKDLKYAFLGEFGSKVKNNMLPYIVEHCNCLCENNTIEFFSKLL